ncbi:intermembrane transport protein PqiB [Marinobacteraceae bacterium S3BR75-40.1]
MSDDLSEAKTRPPKSLGISPVWLIPLAAAFVGGWLLYQSILTRGPQITLELDNAEGVEGGKTTVKVRNVEVGRVENVRLSDDFNGAIAEVQMNPGTHRLLKEDSKFWVVKPRIGRRGISGLNTILSGPYIQMQPGNASQTSSRFQVLEQPPVTQQGVAGLSLQLTSDLDAALNPGDPVIYQGQTVGQIDTANFDANSRKMHYGVFIEDPYARLVSDTTQFWNRSGLSLNVTSEGLSVEMKSLESILGGGITFGQPDGVREGGPVSPGATFRLYASRYAALQDRYDEEIEYVMLVEDSVRGLNEGAPVSFRGIRIGTVKKVPFFNADVNTRKLGSFKIPVLIAFEPQRVQDNWPEQTLDEWRERMKELFERGLRASVRPGNLLTGAMYVAVEMQDDPQQYSQQTLGPYTVFPSQPSGFSHLQERVLHLVNQLNAVDWQGLSESLDATLATTTSSLKRGGAAMEKLDRLLKDANKEDLPKNMRAALEDLRTTLDAYQAGSPTHDKLIRVLNKLNEVLNDVRPLAETLRRRPQALIFGSEPDKDPVPRATQ